VFSVIIGYIIFDQCVKFQKLR